MANWVQALSGLLVTWLIESEPCLVCWWHGWLSLSLVWSVGDMADWVWTLSGLLVTWLIESELCLGCWWHMADWDWALSGLLVTWLIESKLCLVCWWHGWLSPSFVWSVGDMANWLWAMSGLLVTWLIESEPCLVYWWHGRGRRNEVSILYGCFWHLEGRQVQVIFKCTVKCDHVEKHFCALDSNMKVKSALWDNHCDKTSPTFLFRVPHFSFSCSITFFRDGDQKPRTCYWCVLKVCHYTDAVSFDL